MLNTESIKFLLGSLAISDKGERLLRYAATLLLVMMIARTGAELTWQLASAMLDKTGNQPSAAVAEPPAVVAKNRIPQRTTEEISLFGQAAGTAGEVEPATPEAAPETTLNLILKGVVAAQPMRRALAIIAEKSGNNEQLYSLGDKIPGNASIKEIYADRVILSRGGILETLFLEGTRPNQEKQAESGRSRRSLIPGGANISSRGDGVNFQINGEYWEDRLEDLPGLAREVGVEIYKENDRQKGYRLISAQGSRLLASLGLQPGDILLSVNGRSMDSVQNGLAAYQQIRNGGRVQISIIRNGRQESRIYNIGG